MNFARDVKWAVRWNFVNKAARVVTDKICEGGRAIYNEIKEKQNERDNQNGTPVVRPTAPPNSNISQSPRTGEQKPTSSHGQSDSGDGFSPLISRYQKGQPSGGSYSYNSTDQWIFEEMLTYTSGLAVTNIQNERDNQNRTQVVRINASPNSYISQPARTGQPSGESYVYNLQIHVPDQWIVETNPGALSSSAASTVPTRPPPIIRKRPSRSTDRNNQPVPVDRNNYGPGRTHVQSQNGCNHDSVKCCCNCRTYYCKNIVHVHKQIFFRSTIRYV